MNQIKISIVIVILFSSMIVAQQPFEYEVFMQKDTFLVGEIVDIGVSIINKSKTVQKSGHVNIKMFGESGNEIRSNYASGGWASPEHKELQLNDESYWVVQLNRGFGEQYSLSDYNHFTKPGAYKIRFYFSTYDYTKRDSLERVIKIIAPEGEEAIVYNTYVETINRKPYNPSVEEVTKLESLIASHPNSVYVPPILTVLGCIYDILLEDFKNGEKVSKRLIENYSWSSTAIGAIYNSCSEKLLPSKAERLTLIKNLISKAKNSPMQKLLEQKLTEEMGK